jgi:Saccharopine dehydrogenase NADP binding domain
VTASQLTVLILGGYGTFGGRLARLLRDEPRLTLVIAGRSKTKAQEFCDELRIATGARVAAMAVDRDADLAAAFTAIAPHVVVDASGPFQSYGDDRYRVVKAALGVRAHYMDLADGSDFVRNIVELDAAAQAARVFVLGGTSSFPALTAAAVRRLISTAGIAHLNSITAGVAPLPYAAVGLNVIRAIAGYAGQPVPLRRGGRTATAYPLTETRPYTIAPPGFRPLPPLTFSLVDVPDLTLLADLWPEVEEIWVGAAPLPAIWHRLLRWLAWGVRARVLPSLTLLAPLMYRTMNVLTWGERRGGMFVEVTGRRADGTAVTSSWHLLAEGDDGPLIPCMAAEAVVRRVLDGAAPAPGARAAMRELELADYARAFARRTIHCGERQSNG